MGKGRAEFIQGPQCGAKQENWQLVFKRPKLDINELIYETEIDSQTQKTNVVTKWDHGVRGEGEIN